MLYRISAYGNEFGQGAYIVSASGHVWHVRDGRIKYQGRVGDEKTEDGETIANVAE